MDNCPVFHESLVQIKCTYSDRQGKQDRKPWVVRTACTLSTLLKQQCLHYNVVEAWSGAQLSASNYSYLVELRSDPPPLPLKARAPALSINQTLNHILQTHTVLIFPPLQSLLLTINQRDMGLCSKTNMRSSCLQQQHVPIRPMTPAAIRVFSTKQRG